MIVIVFALLDRSVVTANVIQLCVLLHGVAVAATDPVDRVVLFHNCILYMTIDRALVQVTMETTTSISLLVSSPYLALSLFGVRFHRVAADGDFVHVVVVEFRRVTQFAIDVEDVGVELFGRGVAEVVLFLARERLLLP